MDKSMKKMDEPKNIVNIIEILQKVIENKRWNKKTLSEMAGVKQRTVSRWFTGESVPSSHAINNISKNGDVSTLFLNKGIGPLSQQALWAHYAREAATPALIDSIYERIDEVLAASGLNKAQLAAKSGFKGKVCPDDKWWMYCDEYLLSPRDIERIADATGYNKDWIWYGKGERLAKKGKSENVTITTTTKAGKNAVVTPIKGSGVKVNIELNDQSTGQPQCDTDKFHLSEKEKIVIMLLRKIGEETTIDNCIAKLKEVYEVKKW